MRKALFHCNGTGKAIYMEELDKGTKLIIGFRRGKNITGLTGKKLLAILEETGYPTTVKQDFDYFFKLYKGFGMRRYQV